MARPFQIALEECEQVLTPDETVDTTDISDVIEESSEAEEEVLENNELDTQVDALEEASEEADAMLDQAEINEQKIQDDEQGIQEVTDEDVVVSEESFKYSLVKFGYDDGLKDVYNLASESKDLEYTNRKRLQLSTEGISDFIAKVISSIKTLIKKIIISCKKIFAKVMFKFGNYEKRIKLLIKRAELIKVEIKGTLSAKQVKKAVKSYGGIRGAEVYYVLENVKYDAQQSKIIMDQINKCESMSEEFIAKIISGNKSESTKVDKKSLLGGIVDKIKSLFKTSKQGDIENYISSKKPEDYDKDNIVGLIGTKVYYIPKEMNGKLIKSWSPSWKKLSEQEIMSLGTKFGSVKDEIQKLKVLLKEVQNSKSVFKSFDDAQSKYLKFLDNLEDKLKKDNMVNQRALKIGLDVLRVGAAEVNLYAIRKFIYDIRVNVKLSNMYLNVLETVAE